MSEEPEPRTD